MEIELQREKSQATFTHGQILIDGKPECFVVEDVVRDGPKVFGKTAIPAGRYRVIITHSPRFRRPLPLLLDVPGFEGVRIHAGNTAKDTEGCLLPGIAKTAKGVANSRLAFSRLFKKIEAALKRGEEVWITIKDVQP